MARIRSRDKRKARQAKQRSRQCETNVSNVGGLFVIGSAYKRGEQNTPLQSDQVTDIKIATQLALDNMIKGKSTSDDWGMVAGAMNTAMVLSEQGYGFEHLDIFIRAQEAVARSYERGTRTGSWRFDGPGLQDVLTAVDLHEQQCDLVTIGDIKGALEEVEYRAKHGNTFQIERVTV
ncbi:MAG: hypothetical protein ACEQSE_09270 [Candidatus Aquirickettsiella gammari]